MPEDKNPIVSNRLADHVRRASEILGVGWPQVCDIWTDASFHVRPRDQYGNTGTGAVITPANDNNISLALAFRVGHGFRHSAHAELRGAVLALQAMRDHSIRQLYTDADFVERRFNEVKDEKIKAEDFKDPHVINNIRRLEHILKQKPAINCNWHARDNNYKNNSNMRQCAFPPTQDGSPLKNRMPIADKLAYAAQQHDLRRMFKAVSDMTAPVLYFYKRDEEERSVLLQGAKSGNRLELQLPQECNVWVNGIGNNKKGINGVAAIITAAKNGTVPRFAILSQTQTPLEAKIDSVLHTLQNLQAGIKINTVYIDDHAAYKTCVDIKKSDISKERHCHNKNPERNFEPQSTALREYMGRHPGIRFKLRSSENGFLNMAGDFARAALKADMDDLIEAVEDLNVPCLYTNAPQGQMLISAI